MIDANLTLLKEKGDVFRELLNSKTSGNIIGVTCEKFGPGVHLTSVEDLLQEDGNISVIFKAYDSTGYFLPFNKVAITEIEAVSPVEAKFRNPFEGRLVSTDDRLNFNF